MSEIQVFNTLKHPNSYWPFLSIEWKDVMIEYFDQNTQKRIKETMISYITKNNSKILQDLEYYKNKWFYPVCSRFVWEDYPDYYKAFCELESSKINSWQEVSIILEPTKLNPKIEIICIKIDFWISNQTSETVFSFREIIRDILSNKAI